MDHREKGGGRPLHFSCFDVGPKKDGATMEEGCASNRMEAHTMESINVLVADFCLWPLPRCMGAGRSVHCPIGAWGGFYAAFLTKSQQGQRLQRLASLFLYFLQHLILQLVNCSSFGSALLYFFGFCFFFPILIEQTQQRYLF